MVTIGGEKMAKSLGNFTTARRGARPSTSARAFRLAVLQTHYRRAVDLGPTRARRRGARRVERLDALFRRADAAGRRRRRRAPIDATVDAFRAAMDDDFNTPHAMAVVFDAVRGANRAIDDGDLERAASLLGDGARAARRARPRRRRERRATGDDAEIDALVRERDEARAARDFARADALRDELTARGIKLEDTPGGTDLAPMSGARADPRRSANGVRHQQRRQSERRGARDDRGQQVEGRRAVRELLVAGRRKVHELWLSPDADDAPDPRRDRGARREAGVRIRQVPGDQIERQARTDAPQGVSRSRRRSRPPTSTTCSPIPGAFLVALDGVTDPQNLGAVLRTAETAGATGVVLATHRAVGLTPAVAKAAAGAVEYLPVAFVSGIPGALDRAKRAGVWCVGLDADGDQSRVRPRGRRRSRSCSCSAPRAAACRASRARAAT